MARFTKSVIQLGLQTRESVRGECYADGTACSNLTHPKLKATSLGMQGIPTYEFASQFFQLLTKKKLDKKLRIKKFIEIIIPRIDKLHFSVI